MTQRPTANPKLASQIQSDASWTDYERQFLMDYVRKPTPSAAADNEANKENVPNYNPQVLSLLLGKQSPKLFAASVTTSNEASSDVREAAARAEET